MSGPALLVEAGRRSGVVLLLAVLLFPLLVTGLAEEVTARGAEETVLVAPPGPSETQGEPERVAAPLVVLLLTGLASVAPNVPLPISTRLLTREADRISGSAVLPFVSPPPRRA